MEYIMLYEDALECMEPLSDAECGRLIRALLQYKRTKQAPKLSGGERVLFPTFRAQLDRDEKRYEKKCRVNAENGRRGGRPKMDTNKKKSECFPENRTVFPKTQKSQEKEKEKEKEYIPPIVPHGDERADAFKKFWAAYPRKVGKQAALRAWKKVDAPVDALLTALAAQKKTGQWQRDGGQYIPYPATWLSGRRWEDEMQTEVEDVNDLPYFDRYQ